MVPVRLGNRVEISEIRRIRPLAMTQWNWIKNLMALKMTMRKADYSEYKERLLAAAGEIIEADGLEGLTAARLAAVLGLRRTVVHYHFGTMDDLLAALITRSAEQALYDIQESFSAATVGDDLWARYSISMPQAEAIRARAFASKVVGDAYSDAVAKLSDQVSQMLANAYSQKGIAPEVPTNIMARVILMAAQFVGLQRALGSDSNIDAVEQFMRSLFAITAADAGEARIPLAAAPTARG